MGAASDSYFSSSSLLTVQLDIISFFRLSISSKEVNSISTKAAKGFPDGAKKMSIGNRAGILVCCGVTQTPKCICFISGHVLRWIALCARSLWLLRPAQKNPEINMTATVVWYPLDTMSWPAPAVYLNSVSNNVYIAVSTSFLIM